MKEKNVFIADILEKVNRLWNNGEVSLAGDLVAPDFVRYVPGSEPVSGPNELGESILTLREQYPDLIITFEENIFDGETMVLRWRFQGTDLGGDPLLEIEPTGRKIDYKGVDVLHIKDGKIADDFSYFDQATILQQLGLMPEMG